MRTLLPVPGANTGRRPTTAAPRATIPGRETPTKDLPPRICAQAGMIPKAATNAATDNRRRILKL
jgi:hypothetical protein